MLPAKQSRPDIAFKRARWKAHQNQIDPKRLIFIDETWNQTNMAPLRGWGPRRQRLDARVPYGHWKTLTFIGALRHDRVDAPFVIDQPINSELFTAYVEQRTGSVFPSDGRLAQTKQPRANPGRFRFDRGQCA